MVGSIFLLVLMAWCWLTGSCDQTLASLVPREPIPAEWRLLDGTD